MNSIYVKFAKGFKNITELTFINLTILLSIIIILALLYLKYKKIELYTEPLKTTQFINDYSYISSFIDKYIKKLEHTNKNKLIMKEQENKIQNIGQLITDTINPN